jgi:hypothetical protein
MRPYWTEYPIDAARCKSHPFRVKCLAFGRRLLKFANMTPMKIILLCCLMTLSGFIGCSKNDGTSENTPKPSTEIKVKIGVNGETYVDNKLLTQEEFMQELQRLKQANGGIIYSRENPTAESSPAQSSMIEMLQESGIPLRFSKN